MPGHRVGHRERAGGAPPRKAAPEYQARTSGLAVAVRCRVALRRACAACPA
jgi:hypothetical protein